MLIRLWLKLGVSLAVIYFLAFLLPAVSVSFSYVLLTTLLIVLPGWVGDRMVLPHLRNAVASILDGVYAFAILWIAAMFAPFSNVTFTYLLLASLAIGSFEYAFHRLVFKRENYEKGVRS